MRIPTKHHIDGFVEPNESIDQWISFTQPWNKTRLIIRFNDEKTLNLQALEKIAAKYDAKIVNTVSFGRRVDAVVFELPSVRAASFKMDMDSTTAASYIESSMLLRAQLIPNDPYWHLQWGPQKIMADWAWNITVGSSETFVAVIDTGIYYWHEDLSNNYVALGYDWVNNDPDPIDDHGHGTHCAGIIAAVLNNNVGISGLAQVIKIVG